MAEAIGFFADVIGIGTGLSSVFSLGGNGLPPQVNGANTLNVQMGTYGGGGKFSVGCYNYQNTEAGFAYGTIAPGASASLQLGGNGDSQQAQNCTFTPFIYSNDGDYSTNLLCISGISLTQAGSGADYVWSGSNWDACGYVGYAGGVHWGQNADGSDSFPHCAVFQSTMDTLGNMNIIFPTFHQETSSSTPPSASALCQPNAQLYFEKPNQIKDPNAQKRSQDKRSLFERATSAQGPYKGKNETRMTMSTVLNDTSNSASVLCSMSNSYGPDYINLNEGMMCDMSTRTLKSVSLYTPAADLA